MHSKTMDMHCKKIAEFLKKERKFEWHELFLEAKKQHKKKTRPQRLGHLLYYITKMKKARKKAVIQFTFLLLVIVIGVSDMYNDTQTLRKYHHNPYESNPIAYEQKMKKMKSIHSRVFKCLLEGKDNRTNF